MLTRAVGQCICVLLAAAVAGCVSEQRPVAKDGGAARPVPAQLTHARVEMQTLGEVPNSGLFLPAVSSDGQWIAWIELPGQPSDPQELFEGRGLEGVALYVRPLEGGGEARRICASGAAWPSWSADSARLTYIVYDGGGCSACVFDAATGQITVKSPALGRLMMPALSPDGRRLAVVARRPEAAAWQLHVIDLAGGEPIRCEETDAGASQYWPQWADNERVVYIRIGADGAGAWHWSPPRFAPQRLCDLAIGAEPMGIFQAQAGIARPLSGDGRQLAYYDVAAGRIALAGLSTGGRTELGAGTRAGCWLNDRRYAAADDSELRLYDAGDGSVRLMRGRWLPRCGLPQTSALILAAQGSHPRVLSLAKMTVLAGDVTGNVKE